MSVDVHKQVVGGDAPTVDEPVASNGGWTTDEDLRQHLLGDATTADEQEPDPVAVVADAPNDEPAEVAVSADAGAHVSSDDQPRPKATESPEFVELRRVHSESEARFDKLLGLLERQNAAPTPPTTPQPDPWTRPSTDHIRESARVRLGDVSSHLLDQYTTQVKELARWEGATEDTPDRATNITQIKQNMRELHLRADDQTKLAGMQQGFDERLQALEAQPQKAATATRAESFIRGKLTHVDLAGAGYARLANAAKNGTLNADALLRGVEFGAIDLSNPTTFGALDERLTLCDELMSGMAPSSPPTTPTQADQTAPSGVRLANVSALTIPDQPGSTEPVKPRFWPEDEYDAEMAKHLTGRTTGGMTN